jgi:hypothetical protein
MAVTDYKCVYVLTSNGQDLYSAMTQISVASLTRTNPQRQVVLSCDDITYRNLKAEESALLSLFNNVIVEQVVGGDALFKNRWVKTKLRTLIDGPFLYLDADTLVRGPIELLLSDNTDFAAASNHSFPEYLKQIWDQDQAFLDKVGWKTLKNLYLNGGVLYFNDTKGAQKLAESWHKLWLEGGLKTGRYRDQPALNAALACTALKVEILDSSLNAQFNANPRVATDATIWHYYGSGEAALATSFELEAARVVASNYLDYDVLSNMISEPFPWRSITPIDLEAAAHFSECGEAGSWSFEWLARRPVQMRYIAEVSRILKKLNRRIYIWGAGSFGRSVNKEIEALGGETEGYLTSYSEQEQLEIGGRKVHNGEPLITQEANRPDQIFIFVATQFQDEVLPVLNRMGLSTHMDYVTVALPEAL